MQLAYVAGAAAAAVLAAAIESGPQVDAARRQVDVQRLFDCAVRHQGTIQLPLRRGQYVRHGDVVFRHTFDPADADAEDLLRHIEIGPDRTWEQDPLLAFRLLVDIGLRAQSAAINDPATCRHTIDAVSGLLRYIADRHLTIGDIADPSDRARLVLRPVTWEEYVPEDRRDEIRQRLQCLV